MSDKTVDDFLPTLKFVLDKFVTNKMIEKLYNALFADNNIFFFDKDSGNVTFSRNEIGILWVDLNYINLDDTNFNEDVHKPVIQVRLSTWRNDLKQCKLFKKEISKELMPVAWHPTRWCDWCMPKDKKKEIEPLL